MFISRKTKPSGINSLFEDYQKSYAEFIASDSEELIVIGNYSDYDEGEFLTSTDDYNDICMKIFVHMNKVYITAGQSISHEVTSWSMACYIFNRIESQKKFAKSFCISGSTGFNIKYILGCGKTFCKHPNASITLRNNAIGDRTDPCLVVEVAYSHKTFNLLLYEASAYLSPITQVEYCLIIKLWPYRRRFQTRILLCRRTTPQYFSNPRDSKQQTIDFIKDSSINNCTSLDKDSFEKKSKAEIEAHFGFSIIADYHITEENIHDIKICLYLDLNAMAYGSTIYSSNSIISTDFILPVELGNDFIDDLYQYHLKKWNT